MKELDKLKFSAGARS